MSRLVSSGAVLLLTCRVFAAHASEIDVTAVALEIAREHASPQEWAAFQRDAESRFETWKINNFFGSRKNFLDDKLLATATGVPSGKVETLKRFMFYLALYKIHREPPPWYIRHMAQRHGREFLDLLQNFSWEDLAKRVRKKSDEVKAAEAAEKEAAKAAKKRANETGKEDRSKRETNGAKRDAAAPQAAPASPAPAPAPSVGPEPLREGEAFAAAKAEAEARAPDIETAPANLPRVDPEPREAVAANQP